MAVADDSRSKPSGFEGGVAGLGLADLIQLNAGSRFSGCYRVRHDDRVGLIFFREFDDQQRIGIAAHGRIDHRPEHRDVAAERDHGAVDQFDCDRR